MTIKTKRVYDKPEPEDGIRIMIARYPIRGQRKEDRQWNEWWKELAPSKELHHDWYHSGISWDDYVARFTKEINENPTAQEALHRLNILSETNTVTILCHCVDETRCHRSLIKQIVERPTLPS